MIAGIKSTEECVEFCHKNQIFPEVRAVQAAPRLPEPLGLQPCLLCHLQPAPMLPPLSSCDPALHDVSPPAVARFTGRPSRELMWPRNYCLCSHPSVSWSQSLALQRSSMECISRADIVGHVGKYVCATIRWRWFPATRSTGCMSSSPRRTTASSATCWTLPTLSRQSEGRRHMGAGGYAATICHPMLEP